MAAAQTNASRLAALVAIAPLLVGAWFVAPLMLPMWRWQNVDFEVLAKSTGKSQAELERKYHIVFRCAERGAGDPLPWQVLEMKPEWEGADEKELTVRATIISDRTGEPVSSLQLGSGHYKDRYFQADAWRLPPGSLGFNKHRPVIIFEHGTLEKLSIAQSGAWDEKVGSLKNQHWTSDDDAVEDGYTVPQ